MRTTLTLDDDLAMMLKQKADETGRPFRDVVNDAIRHGLDAGDSVEVLPPFPQPKRMGWLHGDRLPSDILDEMDEEYAAKKMRGGS